MARAIKSRLKICGKLQAETPIHAGGYGVSVDTDLPLARNGKNELYIPGTSIAGVLRAWCERNFVEKDANGNSLKDQNNNEIPIKLIKHLFGFQKGDSGQASFVLIEDAKVNLPGNLQTEIRDGVGIDRFYGTAAEGAKYDRAILPKGSTLDLEMMVEIQENEVETKSVVGHLLTAMQNEEIRFGASKTRGLGRVKLIELHEVQTQKFNNILDWIGSDGKGKKLSDRTSIKNEIKKLNLSGISKQGNPKLEIKINWHPTLPLMNKADYEGIGVDMLPVTSGVADGKLSLVLAGSSIKGAFRSHAERIMRTLLDKTAEDEKFDKQIKNIPFVEELFGAKKEKNTTNAKLGLGALSIDDCYSVERFDQANWRDVELAKTTVTNSQGKEEDVSYTHQEFWQAIVKVKTGMQTNPQSAIRNPHLHISHHIAIDRFTGGVAEGALYSVLAPHNIEWSPIKMSLNFRRTQNEEKCLMLLLLVLRDLAENRLPLGFATNRGMGEVKIEKIKIKGEYEIVWENGVFTFTNQAQKEEITAKWKQRINNQKP